MSIDHPSVSKQGVSSVEESTETVKSISQIMLDEVVADSLRPASLGLGVLFAFVAVVNFITIEPPLNMVIGVATGLTAVALLALYFFLGKKTLPSSQAHLVVAIMAGLAVVNNFLRLQLLSNPADTTTVLAIIVLSMGLFFLSSRWLAVTLALTWLGWLTIVFGKQMFADWFQFTMALVVATVIAAIIFRLRMRTMQRYERLRVQSENRRLALHERAGQLETNVAVGQHITSILDIDALLHEVVTLIHDRYGYYYAGIFLLDESGHHIREQASAGVRSHVVAKKGLCLKVGEEGLIGWVAANGRSLRVDDVSQDARYLRVDEMTETQSEIVLPLCVGHELVGVLDLQSTQRAAFSEEDTPFLQLLADQIAIAIYNAMLFQREKSARRLAEMLHQTGQLLSSTLNLTEVLELILKQLADIVSYDRAAMLVPQGQELEFVAFRGYPDDFRPGEVRISIERDTDKIYREIYRTQRPLSIADVTTRPDWQHVPSLPQARSWLGVPLLRSNDVVGMLSLTRETPQPYTEDEVELTTAFAGQAAIALQNAQLYDRVTQFNQQLEYEVKSRTSAVQDAYLQLERLNQTKSDFISVVSHELRTPLTLVRGYSQMLLNDHQLAGNEFHEQLVSGIHGGAVRLGEIVNSMLDMLKIDNHALELYPEPVSIKPMLQLVISQFEQSLADRKMTLVVEDMDGVPPVEGDFEALQKVFYHLIVNAIKYTPDGGRIMINGRKLIDSHIDLPREGIEIIVQDTGIGIDPESQDLIFAKFYQTGKVALHSSGKTAFKAGGPGLGLAIARGIVEAHRGKLWVISDGQDEENCPGSAFHVALPLRQR